MRQPRARPGLRCLTAALLLLAAQAAADPPSPPGAGKPSNPTGYPSVAAALEALRARRDVTISIRDGWTIVEDPGADTLWSFTPLDHPAYPSAVKRVLVRKDGAVEVKMEVLCQAQPASCAQLVADFKRLNERLRQEIERRQGKGV